MYQGDPLSPVIFNTVMSTLVDSLKAFRRECGYSLSGSKLTTNLLLYADDACIVANGPASGQLLLSHVERWLAWTNMRAKVPKCYSLALQASSGRSFDPELTLQGQRIPFTNNQPVRFLGGDITVTKDVSRRKEILFDKLETLLGRVDETSSSDWSPEAPPIQGRHLPSHELGVGHG